MSLLGLCGTCNDAPKGIDGHGNLHVQSQPSEGRNGKYLFRCSSCGARWSRSYAGSGEFAWVLERLFEADDPSGGLNRERGP